MTHIWRALDSRTPGVGTVANSTTAANHAPRGRGGDGVFEPFFGAPGNWAQSSRDHITCACVSFGCRRYLPHLNVEASTNHSFAGRGQPMYRLLAPVHRHCRCIQFSVLKMNQLWLPAQPFSCEAISSAAQYLAIRRKKTRTGAGSRSEWSGRATLAMNLMTRSPAKS